MQHVRRLAAAVTVAVGLVALTGCRAEPGVAAYVGDKRITEDTVTKVIDELRHAMEHPEEPAGGHSHDHGAEPAGDERLPGREQIVTILVLREVCDMYSADQDFQPRQRVQPEQVAQQLGIPADSIFAQRRAQLDTCLSGIPGDAGVEPTEAELAEVVAAGKLSGEIPAEMTVREASTRLDGEPLRGALATRRVLVKAIEDYDVTVNPRYRPLNVPLLSYQSGAAAVSVRLGEDGNGVVVDAR